MFSGLSPLSNASKKLFFLEKLDTGQCPKPIFPSATCHRQNPLELT
jgi:hypothetical protein